MILEPITVGLPFSSRSTLLSASCRAGSGPSMKDGTVWRGPEGPLFRRRDLEECICCRDEDTRLIPISSAYTCFRMWIKSCHVVLGSRGFHIGIRVHKFMRLGDFNHSENMLPEVAWQTLHHSPLLSRPHLRCLTLLFTCLFKCSVCLHLLLSVLTILLVQTLFSLNFNERSRYTILA